MFGSADLRARPLALGLALAATATAVVASCKEDRVHTATLAIAGADGGALDGFDCVEATEDNSHVVQCLVSTCSERCRAAGLSAFGDCIKKCSSDADSGVAAECATGGAAPLLLRGSGHRVCAVVDFLRIGGEVECRAAHVLMDWCLAPEHGTCPVIERQLVPLDLPAGAPGVDAGTPAVAHAVDVLYAALRAGVSASTGPLVSAPAPNEWVIARFMATTQDCSALSDPAQIDLDQVLGCAFSCTVLLHDRDDVPLALESKLEATCQAQAVKVCAALGTPQLAAQVAAISAPSP